jgi:hypothetical protein
VLGFGLLNKISVLFLGVGITLGLCLTSQRSDLRTSGPWLCLLISFLLFLPYIFWNAVNDFPHLEFIRNASAGKYSGLSPLRFATDQFLLNNPLTVPVWLGGIYWYFFTDHGRKYRWLGLAFLGAAAVLLFNRTSKAEYLAAGYSMLFAGGGVFWESVLSKRWGIPLRRVGVVLLSLGLFVAPFGLPILPVESYVRYSSVLGIRPSTSEDLDLAELPQFYADMFGWEDQVRTLAAAYHALPPDEKTKAVIYCGNYGRAGAVDFFGSKYGLPAAISGHNNYWFWIPDSIDLSLVIMLDDEVGEKESVFDSVATAGFHQTPYALPYENNLTVYVCRKPLIPHAVIRNRIRFYQ